MPNLRARAGTGQTKVRRLLAQLDGLYMVDLCCDAELEPFYRRLGLVTLDSICTLAGPMLVRYGIDSGVQQGSTSALWAATGVFAFIPGRTMWHVFFGG